MFIWLSSDFFVFVKLTSTFFRFSLLSSGFIIIFLPLFLIVIFRDVGLDVKTAAVKSAADALGKCMKLTISLGQKSALQVKLGRGKKEN